MGSLGGWLSCRQRLKFLSCLRLFADTVASGVASMAFPRTARKVQGLLFILCLYLLPLL